MSVTVNMKPQVDLPVWEWLRFAPATVAAASCTCADEATGGRYIYYLDTANLWRYDTITDAWQRLQGPSIPPLTASSMRYSTYGGYRGRVLGATNTTLVIPGVWGSDFVGKTIRITEGTGIGQERVISAVADPVIVESGVVSTGGANSLQDLQSAYSTKKWTPNQWRGYQCRVVFATGVTQVRKIIYNDINTLYFFNDTSMAYETWSNAPMSAIAPYAVPAAGTHYYIEAQTITVPAWTTNPDLTSKFMIKNGAIWMITGRTLANGAAAMQYYDIATDTWYYKTCPGGAFGQLLTGDVSLERCGEIGGVFDSGAVVSATSKTLTAAKAWTADQWTGFAVFVTDPATGVVQKSTIIGNTTTTLYIDDTAWDSIPTNTHTFTIEGNRNNIWVTGNNQAALYKYLVEQDLWVDGWHYDNGVTNDLAVKFGKQLPWHYTGAVSTTGIVSVNATPTNGGVSGYRVGDICNVSEATGGQVRVTAVNASGQVTAVELYSGYNTAGTYTTGSGKATTNAYPSSGGGSGLTVNITAGAVGRLTTVIPHNVRPGETVVTTGATVAGWNASFTVLAAPSTTTIQIIPPNTTAPVATSSNSTVLIVDTTKNWTTNEHAGKLVTLYISGVNPSGGSPAPQTVKITSNTATTLTIPAVTAFATGTYRYTIKDHKCFGGDIQERVPARDNTGWASAAGSSPTVLSDPTKNWATSQWVGYKLRVICGTGYDKGQVVITANDATTLTSAGWGFTPDATTKYEIEDSYGVCTTTFGTTSTLIDATKNWPINIWTNKRVRINAGAGVLVETTVVSNTATVLTVTASALTQPTATTCYSILGNPVRAVGFQMAWNFGQTGADKGKYLYVPIGGTAANAGAQQIDRYNITTNRWDYSIMMEPITEPHYWGTQWAYDNKDRFYFTSGISGRIMYLDLNTRKVVPSGQTPYAHGTAVGGNRMEIVTTADGLQFLYVMRHTGTEFWRTLLFW